MLLGRSAEQAVLTRTIDSARHGTGTALVLRGDAGIGKTSLIADAIESAEDFSIVVASGIESETPLAYAALHRVLLPFLGSLEDLPTPQCDALSAAFGLVDSEAPDQFLVGLATLTLLAEAARSRPLLCVLDDAQWLDRDSLGVLAFVARRLLADSIAVVFAARGTSADLPMLQGMDDLVLGALSGDASRALLATTIGAAVDHNVSSQIVAQTQGNPLAIVELAAELSTSQLTGRSELPQPLPIGRQVEARFLRQVGELPDLTRTALVLAAADTTGSPLTLGRAAALLNVPAEAMEPAELAGLLVVATKVEFRHPLIRSAVYSGATDAERRRVHTALATVTDAEADADLRASHLAAAAREPDEHVARLLEDSAERARRRGGNDAELALLIRAARLTPETEQRARRLLAAATAAAGAGNPRSGAALLDEAQPILTDPRLRADAQRLDGRLCLPLAKVWAAPSRLLNASRALEAVDPDRARETMLEAMNAFAVAGPYSRGVTADEMATAASALIRTSATDASPVDQILAACASLVTGRGSADTTMREVSNLLSTSPITGGQLTGWLELSVLLAIQTFDERVLRDLLDHMDCVARERGALLALRTVLSGKAAYAIRSGRFDLAATHFAEHHDVATACGAPFEPVFLQAELLAWQGDPRVRTVARSLAESAEAFGSGALLHTAMGALAVFELGEGRYADALVASRRVADDGVLGWECRALPNVIEAAVRSEEFAVAADAVARLEICTMAAETPLGDGILARALALTAPADAAETSYRRALNSLSTTVWTTELARTHLVYGEWLRRRKRRSEAREQLRTAHEMFSTMGANGFAERARVELLATGERARSRRVDSTRDLTPRELQIARLAAQRATSREIGAQLFISPNTVDYHLRKVFQKLGVSSRRELTDHMPPSD